MVPIYLPAAADLRPEMDRSLPRATGQRLLSVRSSDLLLLHMVSVQGSKPGLQLRSSWPHSAAPHNLCLLCQRHQQLLARGTGARRPPFVTSSVYSAGAKNPRPSLVGSATPSVRTPSQKLPWSSCISGFRGLVLHKPHPTPTPSQAVEAMGHVTQGKKGQFLPHGRRSFGVWPAAGRCGSRLQASTPAGGCPPKGQRLLGH